MRRLLSAERVEVLVVGRPGDTEEQVIDRVRASLARPPSSLRTDVFDMCRTAVHETCPGAGTVAAQFEAATSTGPIR